MNQDTANFADGITGDSEAERAAIGVPVLMIVEQDIGFDRMATTRGPAGDGERVGPERTSEKCARKGDGVNPITLAYRRTRGCCHDEIDALDIDVPGISRRSRSRIPGGVPVYEGSTGITECKLEGDAGI